MKIFIAVRWGHDESPEGGNGEDTNFLVRANDRDEAAAIVDSFLKYSLHHNKVDPICNVIIELGSDYGGGTESAILHGPWYSFFHMNCPRDYTSWIREDHTGNKWMDYDELYPPEETPR